mgnify:CR=1 FL=1
MHGDARGHGVYAHAGFGGFQMSAQNLVLEFGPRSDLPMRIGVANSASEFVAALVKKLAEESASLSPGCASGSEE